MSTYEIIISGNDLSFTMEAVNYEITMAPVNYEVTISGVGLQGGAGPKGDPGSVDSVDVVGGTGIDSTGGPVTTVGVITVALDAATQTAVADAGTAVQPGDPLTDLSSGAASQNDVPTADGLGGIAWAAQSGSGGGIAEVIGTADEIDVAGGDTVSLATGSC